MHSGIAVFKRTCQTKRVSHCVFFQQFHFNFNRIEFPLNACLWWCRVKFELANGHEMNISTINYYNAKCNWNDRLITTSSNWSIQRERKKMSLPFEFVMMRVDISGIPTRMHFNSSFFVHILAVPLFIILLMLKIFVFLKKNCVVLLLQQKFQIGTSNSNRKKIAMFSFTRAFIPIYFHQLFCAHITRCVSLRNIFPNCILKVA